MGAINKYNVNDIKIDINCQNVVFRFALHVTSDDMYRCLLLVALTCMTCM